MNEEIKIKQAELDKIEAEIKEKVPGVYVIRERISNCKMCNKEEDLRFGWCFDCAEAQTILGTGKDMYEKGDGGTELPTKEVNARLKMLVDKGWVCIDKKIETA